MKGNGFFNFTIHCEAVFFCVANSLCDVYLDDTVLIQLDSFYIPSIFTQTMRDFLNQPSNIGKYNIIYHKNQPNVGIYHHLPSKINQIQAFTIKNQPNTGIYHHLPSKINQIQAFTIIYHKKSIIPGESTIFHGISRELRNFYRLQGLGGRAHRRRNLGRIHLRGRKFGGSRCVWMSRKGSERIKGLGRWFSWVLDLHLWLLGCARKMVDG